MRVQDACRWLETIRQPSAVSSGFGDGSFVVEWRARSL